MTEQQYIDGEPVVKMKKVEYDSKIAETFDRGYKKAREESADIQKELQNALKAEEQKTGELQKEILRLQIICDQYKRTLKEVCKCFQFETGNGFIE